MSRRSTAIEILPGSAAAHLEALGAHLRIARQRRGDSLKTLAGRIGTSIPTLRRMEAGDPRVAIGIYAATLWAFGKVGVLAEILDPASDEYATALDVERAGRRRGAR